MKLALVGPGIMSIPPNGWGAVEMMLWDYYNILKSNSIDVVLINIPDRNEIVKLVNEGNFDVVHIHYDAFSDILAFLKPKVVIISSHYPFINDKSKYNQDGYHSVFNKIVKEKNAYIFASSQKDINTFLDAGVKEERLFHSKLGIDSSSYLFTKEHEFDKTICFSQIVNRKRQYMIQNIENIDFFGKYSDSNFNLKNYKGEIGRKELNKLITKYSNFILISSTENTTPLVVKEALVCGLGVVVSETVSVELDVSKPFISVLKENEINNEETIKQILEKNKKESIFRREEIREYGINNFDLKNILVNQYLKKIEQLTK